MVVSVSGANGPNVPPNATKDPELVNDPAPLPPPAGTASLVLVQPIKVCHVTLVIVQSMEHGVLGVPGSLVQQHAVMVSTSGHEIAVIQNQVMADSLVKETAKSKSLAASSDVVSI